MELERGVTHVGSMLELALVKDKIKKRGSEPSTKNV